MKVKNLAKKFLCIASAVAMAVALMAEPIQVQAAGEVYTSELTGLPISASLKDQRPIAVMVDNEKVALKHFGTAEADIVYEMMNSTANDRITRLMCIYKDYNSVPTIGSIRSIRPTNVILAGEYNAICVHDGGPYYINEWLAKPWSDNLSAGFARIPNGKKREFTEYVTTGEVNNRIAAAGYSKNYTPLYLSTRERESHFLFNPVETLLSTTYGGVGVASATQINLTPAFPHNKSMLKYNANTMTYDYYEYGSLHTDGEDGQALTFKNVILQETSFSQLDAHGYLIYNAIGYMPSTTATGYYFTDGQVIPITWYKNGETAITKYYDYTGQEIKLNLGKTYIGLVPSDAWTAIGIG